MAKVPFSKLKCTKKDDIKTITINDIEIEVKQYLSTADKLELIANVLNQSVDAEVNSFMNPVKVDIFGTLEIIFAYTNLSFTEKQKEDVAKLYDLLETNGITEAIISAIPEVEYQNLISAIDDTIAAYYQYKNSALGIFEIIGNDYSELNLDLDTLQEKISNPNNLTLLKGVMNELV